MYLSGGVKDACEPCRPKKAPVFQIGDVVESIHSKRVFRVGIILIRFGSLMYVPEPTNSGEDLKLHQHGFEDGHSLKKFTGKSK